MTHHHDHHHDVTSDLTFEEKLIKLLEHWLKHNHDHAHTYREWAERAKANDLTQVAVLIDEIGEITRVIDEKIKEALKTVSIKP
jgi:hypothetical protein